METVQQKALLSVIEFPVITKDSIQSGIQSAVGLVAIQNNIISKTIRSSEIILCSGISELCKKVTLNAR